MNVCIFRTWWDFKKTTPSDWAVCISVIHLQRSGLKCLPCKARRWTPLLGAGIRGRENCSAYLERLVSDSLILWPKPRWKRVHSRKQISNALWLKKGLQSQVKRESNLHLDMGQFINMIPSGSLSTPFISHETHLKGLVLQGFLPSFLTSIF